MKRILRQQSIPSDGYSCMFTSRPGPRPRLRDRILGWFLNCEPESNAQYDDYDEYEAEPERAAFHERGGAYEYSRPREHGVQYGRDDRCDMDKQEVAIHTRPVLALSEGRLRRVQQALNEWKAATAYFESVSDPELVDYAVYEMEAAQKRYIYLLRSAKSVQDSFARGR